MKTAVSLPDELFQRADALAHSTGKSRSQVYRDALSEYLARHEPHTVTPALDAIADELDAASDPWSTSAARHALVRSEW